MTSDHSNYAHLRCSTPFAALSSLDFAVSVALMQELDALRREKFGIILDFGAGNAPYRQLFECDRYIAADVQQNVDNSIDLLIDGPRTVLADASVDLVLCIFVLEHVPDYKLVLRELYRVLKPGGRMFIAVPFISREHETPNDYLRFTSFMLQSLFPQDATVRTRKAGNALHAAFSLWYESNIRNGERPVSSAGGRLLRWLCRRGAPLLNRTVFRRQPSPDDGVYTSLLADIRKGQIHSLTES